ncbi:MAG: sialidase family protein [Candidatus Thorarchaeota archaeon]
MKASSTFLISLLLVSQFLMVPFALVGQSSRVLAQNNSLEFGTNIRVTDGTSPYTDQVEPTLAILSDGRILVGWKEAESHDGPGRRVGFAYSTDGGRTYTPNILMTRLSSNNFQSDPWLVADANDNAYFVWIEFNDIAVNNPPEGVGVAKTIDGGESWTPPVNAADTPEFDDKETACVDSEGNLYIVWDHFTLNQNYEITDYDLRFTNSTDGGASFSPTIIPAVPAIPYIHCSSNDTLFITYINGTTEEAPNNQIFLTKSSDRGLSWSPSVLINPFYDLVDLITVVNTDSQQNVYVAYSAGSSIDPNYREIYVIKSTDGGLTWSTPVQVNDDSIGMQRMVEMYIADDDSIHVAWLDARLGGWNIYYSYSTDGATTFSPNERISEVGFPLTFTRPGDYFCMRPAPDGTMCIVWTDGRNGIDHDIYFARQGLFLSPLPALPFEWLVLIVIIVVLIIIILLVIWLLRRRIK